MDMEEKESGVSPDSFRKIRAFNSLGPGVLQTLSPWCHFRHFNRGEAAFRQGDNPRTFLAVCQGSFKLSNLSPSGKEVILHLVFSGDLMGAVVAVAGKPFPATAIALRRSMVIEIPVIQFQKACADHGVAQKELLSHISGKLHESHSLRLMQSERVETRLAHALVMLGSREDVQGKWVSITKEELATLVNTTTETCIRTLSPWAKSGLIETSRGKLRVLEIAALQALADGNISD